MVGIAQRVIPMADFGKTSAGQFRQGTYGLSQAALSGSVILPTCRSLGLAERNG
jgi:hypothetical protein